MSGLPCCRDVIEPHPDVAQGRYKNAEFAADLAQVARGEGAYEYRDPIEFFSRTYVTEGMKGLLVQAQVHNPHPAQRFHPVSQIFAHPANLPVHALHQHDVEFPLAGFFHPAGQGHPVQHRYAGSHAPDKFRRHGPVHRHLIFLFVAPRGPEQPVDDFSVAGQKQ